MLTLDANTNELQDLEWLNEEVPEWKARAPRPPPEVKPKTPEEGEAPKEEEEEKQEEEKQEEEEEELLFIAG